MGNGTGNKRIQWHEKTGADCPNSQEPIRFWQHLKLARLIDGNYSGVCSDEGYSYLDSYVSSYSEFVPEKQYLQDMSINHS